MPGQQGAHRHRDHARRRAAELTRSFASVAALTPAGGDGAFTAEIDAGWTIAGRPNGGYLLALLGAAAVRVGPHPHVMAASAHYLRSPVPGTATVVAQVLRAGTRASQLRTRLLQDDRACVEALVTTGTVLDADRPYWDAGVPDPGTGTFEQAIRVPAVAPTGAAVPLMEQIHLRLDPASIGFGTGHPTGRGELRGWLALPDGANFDPVSLLFAVDAFPPATFDIEPSGWVPTFELTAYIRALPAPGPVRVLQRAHLVNASLVDEACWVWDVHGRVVAQATQLAGVRLGGEPAQ